MQPQVDSESVSDVQSDPSRLAPLSWWYYRSQSYRTLRQLDKALARWASWKYKKLRYRPRRAARWIARISRNNLMLFAHWQMVRRGSVVGAV